MSKPLTAFSSPLKSKTAFTSNAKPKTGYISSSDPSGFGWQLNSPVVTLNSLVYLLNGFQSQFPNTISFKPRTAYAQV